MDSSSVHGLSLGRSADMPLAIDEDPQVDLNIQVGKLPSSPETRAPSKRNSKSPIIRLGDPTTGSKSSHENSHIFSRAQELSASVSSNLIDPVFEATVFGWGSDLSDLSDDNESGDDNESEEDVSSSGSPEVGPYLLKLAILSDFRRLCFWLQLVSKFVFHRVLVFMSGNVDLFDANNDSPPYIGGSHA